jgi:hypothetical protein
VNDLGLTGKDEFNGALEVGDVQRFVSKVQHQNVAQDSSLKTQKARH